MAKSKEARPDAPAYEMPRVEVGDIVLWHAAAQEPPVSLGVVTTVSKETISCSLAHANFYNLEPKDGVRHRDHPERGLIESTEAGCWSHTPRHLATEARLAELESILLASSGTGA